VSLVETLAWLVDTASETGNEERLAAMIEDRFSGRPTRRIGDSIVVGGPEGRPFIVLYGHTDTVPEQGNLPHRIEGERMVGLGTSDMKSGLAVMIHLLEAGGWDYDVAGVFYDKEEGPSADNGLEAVLDAVPWLGDAAASIVLEPTDLRVEVGCNGVLNADVVFTGHAAHSARPWLGENAVTKAGRWLQAMHDREPETFAVGGFEFKEVFSVTTANGGIANNVIPASFTMNLNHRFPPLFDLAEAEERLRTVAAAADDVIIRDRAPAAGVPADNAHVTRLVAMAGGAVGPKQGWTDVARLSARNIAAVNFGPGEVAQAHQATESVPLRNLEVAYDVLARLLSREA
jgi:succinyl-diaminopimelate desuccinylase